MTERPYWKPEPKLLGWAFWSLLIPAAVWILGVVVYGAEAMKAQALVWTKQGIGSLLMVIGGEAGTLFTAMEVYRKSQTGDANAWDWSGLFVSLVSTLGVLFVVFTRQTDIDAAWVPFVRTWGPLVLLLCSGLDFYANVAELGFYRASFERRWEKWNEGRWTHEQRERNRLRELSEPAAAPAPEKEDLPRRRATASEKTAILAQLDGGRAELTADSFNIALEAAGYEPDPQGTARYWANKAREGVL